MGTKWSSGGPIGAHPSFQQSKKTCRVDDHAQKDLLQVREGFRFFHLWLSSCTGVCPGGGEQSGEIRTFWEARTARKGWPGRWASSNRPSEGFGEVSIFSPPPPDPGCGCLALLGCVLGDGQSGEIRTFWGARTARKGWPGRWASSDRPSEGFGEVSISHLPPLTLDVAV